MKIRELIRRLESAEEKHGNIFVGIPLTEGRRSYMGVKHVEINKNKGESFDGYPIVELDDKKIIVME